VSSLTLTVIATAASTPPNTMILSIVIAVLYGVAGGNTVAERSQSRRNRAERVLPPSSCGYRAPVSPTKCARSIGGECLANDRDRPGRREAAGRHRCCFTSRNNKGSLQLLPR
jgi:hypothetical protein